MVEDHDQHRRHRGEELDAVLLDQAQGLIRDEPAHEDAPSFQSHRDEGGENAVAVRQRQRAKSHLVVLEFAQRHRRLRDGNHPAVGQHYALGATGGAAGVEDAAQLVVRARLDFLPWLSRSQQLVEGMRPGGGIRADQNDLGLPGEVGDGLLDCGQELDRGDDGFGFAVGENVLHLGRREQEENWHGHRADAPAARISCTNLRTVGRHHRDPVIGLHAELLQRARNAKVHVAKLKARVPATLEEQRLIVAVLQVQVVAQLQQVQLFTSIHFPSP